MQMGTGIQDKYIYDINVYKIAKQSTDLRFFNFFKNVDLWRPKHLNTKLFIIDQYCFYTYMYLL